MESIVSDLRLAARALARDRRLTLAAVAALALGIGANTLAFSAVRGVLLRPLPFAAPERLVAVFDVQPQIERAPASFPKYVDWRAERAIFEELGGWAWTTAALQGGSFPEVIRIGRVTASLPRALGVQAQLGRLFLDEEDRPGGPAVVVLGAELWRSRFQGRDVLGETLRLDGVTRTIVGVLPDGLEYPRGTEAWVPLAEGLDPETRGSHFLRVVGRLAPGVSVDAAREALGRLAQRLNEEHGTVHGITAIPLHEVETGEARAPLLALMGAVLAVLLIACVDVALLLLARALERSRERAIRTALGASRARLVRQALSESALLALVGGAAGVALAWRGLPLLRGLAPVRFPRVDSIQLDLGVLAFAVAAAIVAGVLAGLVPVLAASSTEVAEWLRGASSTLAGSRHERRVARGLVTAQVALSVVVAAGAGLLTRSLMRLVAVDTGLQEEGVLTFSLSLPEAGYPDEAAVRAFHARALERLAALPGVQAAGAISSLPLTDFGINGDFEIEGRPPFDPRRAPLVEQRMVAGDYFQALGIPLLSGRWLEPRDGAEAEPAALINRTMAERFWPQGDALGAQVSVNGATRRVVGIVGDVRSRSAADAPTQEIYFPVAQMPTWSLSFALRAAGDQAGALAASARGAVRDLDPELPVDALASMEQVAERSLTGRRRSAMLAGVFALLALLLAALGVFGVLSRAATRRTREVGVRMAVGARRRDILRLLLGDAARVVGWGLVPGIFGAVAAGRALRSQLYAVEPFDPAVLAVTAGLVLAAGVVAGWLPARRAAAVDPIAALRTD